jgi:hypothetical protein
MQPWIRPTLAALVLSACSPSDPGGEDNLYVLDCDTEETEVAWDAALDDGTTPLDRLAALGSPVSVSGSWADGRSLAGSFTADASETAPVVTRVVGGVDAAQCDDSLRLPVRLTLTDGDAMLVEANADIFTSPDVAGPLTVAAQLDDQPAWGLDAALEPGELLNGIYLEATTGEATFEGRIFALAEGDDGEVAWQRQVDIVSWSAVTR